MNQRDFDVSCVARSQVEQHILEIKNKIQDKNKSSAGIKGKPEVQVHALDVPIMRINRMLAVLIWEQNQ